MEGFEPDAADAYILLDSHRLDEAAIHQQLLNAEAAGAKRLTVVAPHQRLLEGANREIIFDIARCKDTFADLQSNSVRCLFFLTEDVDSLYDRGFFDDDVYMFLGTSEIKAPKLADVRDDVPLLARRYLQESAAELQIEPAAVPRLNASAGVFLRDRDWPRNHIELKRFMARTLGAVECAGQLLSREELAAVEQQMEAAAPSGSIPDIRARLTHERDEYVKAVYVLSGRDSGKAAIMLGVEPALVDAIVNAA